MISVRDAGNAEEHEVFTAVTYSRLVHLGGGRGGGGGATTLTYTYMYL